MRFKHHIGIDYSGAATPETRSATIQVYRTNRQSTVATGPKLVASPASSDLRNRNWNRIELAEWLIEFLASHRNCIVGIDHGFSFPLGYFQRNKLLTWDSLLVDFVSHWPTDQAGATVEQFRAGNLRAGTADELRLTERWTSSAKSVFQFDVQGSVAKSTHAGLPWLLQIRQQLPEVHFWPFDGWSFPHGKSVIAETFPSLFRNRYPRADRKVDQQDAFAICRWLLDMDRQGNLNDFACPPLSEPEREIAELEGWILGVY